MASKHTGQDIVRRWRTRPASWPKRPQPVPVDQVLSERLIPSLLYRVTDPPGPDIRPCFVLLLETPLVKGEYPGRGGTVVALTAELLRLQKDKHEIEAIIEEWNRSNVPPLKPQEIESAIKAGLSERYAYSCDHPVLASFCIGSQCPYDKRSESHTLNPSNYRFLDFRWPQILTPRQTIIYYAALPFLEIKNRVGMGGRIYASHQQLADIAGIPPRRLGRDLQRLKDVGLITYTPGTPRVWERKASQIQRIIPIPPPRPWRTAKGRVE